MKSALKKSEEKGARGLTNHPAKPHISPSQVETFLNCGEAYRRRYIVGERLPPTTSMIRGGCVHLGAEHNFKQKVKSKVDLPIEEVVEVAAAAFDAKIKAEGIDLNVDELKRGKAIVLAEAKEMVVNLTRLMMKELAPTIKPKLIEEKIRIVLKNSRRDLLGFIDLITEDEWIHDYKTSAKKKNQNDVDKDFQFGFYEMIYRAKFGRPAKGLQVNVLIQTAAGNTSLQVLKTHRDDNDFRAILARVSTVADLIDKGAFAPAPSGSWKCSPKWCGFWSTCAYVNDKG